MRSGGRSRPVAQRSLICAARIASETESSFTRGLDGRLWSIADRLQCSGSRRLSGGRQRQVSHCIAAARGNARNVVNGDGSIPWSTDIGSPSVNTAPTAPEGRALGTKR